MKTLVTLIGILSPLLFTNSAWSTQGFSSASEWCRKNDFQMNEFNTANLYRGKEFGKLPSDTRDSLLKVVQQGFLLNLMRSEWPPFCTDKRSTTPFQTYIDQLTFKIDGGLTQPGDPADTYEMAGWNPNAKYLADDACTTCGTIAGYPLGKWARRKFNEIIPMDRMQHWDSLIQDLVAQINQYGMPGVVSNFQNPKQYFIKGISKLYRIEFDYMALQNTYRIEDVSTGIPSTYAEHGFLPGYTIHLSLPIPLRFVNANGTVITLRLNVEAFARDEVETESKQTITRVQDQKELIIQPLHDTLQKAQAQIDTIQRLDRTTHTLSLELMSSSVQFFSSIDQAVVPEISYSLDHRDILSNSEKYWYDEKTF